MSNKYIQRRKFGKKFVYYTERGEITDEAVINYCNGLRVPPAWKDVRISPDPGQKILATGYDKAGRLQYIYHPEFRAQQEREKFERILKFARALPKMRRAVEKHLSKPGLSREKVLATIVRIMDEAYFRVGGEEYAKKNAHYGISTLRSKHVDVEDETVIFDFVGKSGKRQIKKITDRRIANIIRRLDELPGYEIFKYYDESGNLTKVSSSEVNQYIKQIMGEEFSAKDFRTWGGTLLAAAELSAMERATSLRERKKAVTTCVKRVAKRLGNTPAIARSSYIDPRIISSFVDSDDLLKVKETVRKVGANSYLSTDEKCVLRLLEKAA